MSFGKGQTFVVDSGFGSHRDSTRKKSSVSRRARHLQATDVKKAEVCAQVLPCARRVAHEMKVDSSERPDRWTMRDAVDQFHQRPIACHTRLHVLSKEYVPL